MRGKWRPQFNEKEERWLDMRPLAIVIQADRAKMTKVELPGGGFCYQVKAEGPTTLSFCGGVSFEGVEPDYVVKVPQFELKLNAREETA